MEIQFDKIDIFRKNLSSFKETSKDTDSGCVEYMTQSDIEVINFDGVKNEYVKDLHLTYTPCSNDALYITAGEIYFVEFKNGIMKKDKIFNVYNKIYDSLLIFNDIIGANISFCRKNVNFVLVYNECKNPCPKDDISKSIPQGQDSSKARIGKYFTAKANKSYTRFDLGRFEKLYFKKVFTFTESEFENFFLSAQF